MPSVPHWIEMDCCADNCIDWFGLSISTIGYPCANCTANNYGWMLYILSELSEFVPATVFYFVILTFQIRIKSVPMDCFVMFSQLVAIFLNYTQGFKRDSPTRKATWMVSDATSHHISLAINETLPLIMMIACGFSTERKVVGAIYCTQC